MFCGLSGLASAFWRCSWKKTNYLDQHPGKYISQITSPYCAQKGPALDISPAHSKSVTNSPPIGAVSAVPISRLPVVALNSHEDEETIDTTATPNLPYGVIPIVSRDSDTTASNQESSELSLIPIISDQHTNHSSGSSLTITIPFEESCLAESQDRDPIRTTSTCGEHGDTQSTARGSSSLADSLFYAQFELRNLSRSFIPISALEVLITTTAIEGELRGLVLDEDLHRQAQIIRGYAPKLFAILVLLNKPGYITQLLEARIFDSDLPLQKSVDGSMLCSHQRTDIPIKCTADWGARFLQAFRSDQWSVMAPIFRYSEDMKLNEFDYNCVMPFIHDMEMTEHVKEGGNATVWEVVIHPSHQYLLKSQKPSIALKRLHSTSEEDFFLEVEMLKALSSHRHPHFVKLLATYKYQGRFYLVFPYAKGNLRTYWKTHPVPEFSQVVITWMIKQCKGLSSALLRIHGYQTTLDYKTSTKGPPLLTHDERLYGRHGDIKPENILWTDEDVSDADPKPCEEGLLMIADVGLMRVHSDLTKSQIDPHKVAGSPIYEPPELRLQSKISRAYDIWSMGCVFLEFITWLVGGWNDLERFPSSRIMTEVEESNDDTYFTIMNSEIPGTRTAVVRKSVKEWISNLHNRPRSSQFVHEFLDMISNDMLVIRPENRIQCGLLIEKLSKMLDRAETNPGYLLEAKPVLVRMQEKKRNKERSDVRNLSDVLPLPRRASTANGPATWARGHL